MNHEDPVLLHTEGRVRHIMLNRPRALNALNHAMVARVTEALADAEHDDSVIAVLITGAGERGLCAGGDIRSIYEDARAGGSESMDFGATNTGSTPASPDSPSRTSRSWTAS